MKELTGPSFENSLLEMILHVLKEEEFKLPGTLESSPPAVIPYQVTGNEDGHLRVVDVAFEVRSSEHGDDLVGRWVKKMEVPPSLNCPDGAPAKYLKIAFYAEIMEWWETTDRGDDSQSGIKKVTSP